MSISYGNKDYKARANAKIIGSPIITYSPSGFVGKYIEVSGFTNPRTAILCPLTNKLTNGTFTISMQIKTHTTDVTTQQYFLGQYPRPQDHISPVIGIRSGKFVLYISSNATSWNVANNVQISSITPEADRHYSIKLECQYLYPDQYRYALYIRRGDYNLPTEDSDMVWSSIVSQSTYFNNPPQVDPWHDYAGYISFGNDTWGKGSQSPFLGRVCVNKCSVEIGSAEWSGLGKDSKFSKIYFGNKQIKAVYHGTNKVFGSEMYFDKRYNFTAYGTNVDYGAHLPFNLVDPSVVDNSTLPISVPNIGMEYTVQEVDSNGKPTKLKQATYGYEYTYNADATTLANQKCFGVVNGVDTNNIYRGFLSTSGTSKIGAPCKGTFNVGDVIWTFSMSTGNDPVNRVQIKADGYMYLSGSVFNESLATRIEGSTLVEEKVSHPDILTKQYIG